MTNDLISREALMQFAHNHINGTIDCNDIARFPAVDAAPVVHSRWVWIPDEEEDNTWHLVCDACKHGGLFEDDNYCHNCGAKMDDGGNNDVP